VSPISAIKEVREKMVAIQQQMGIEGRVVMDGRDIGTVVFPKAEVKLFMTASNEIRAQRRLIELLEKGESVSLDDVKKSLAQRDHIDMTREIAPLRKAEDAIEIDNSELNRTEQLELALRIIHDKIQSLQSVK
jgi:cytidylate kinase